MRGKMIVALMLILLSISTLASNLVTTTSAAKIPTTRGILGIALSYFIYSPRIAKIGHEMTIMFELVTTLDISARIISISVYGSALNNDQHVSKLIANNTLMHKFETIVENITVTSLREGVIVCEVSAEYNATTSHIGTQFGWGHGALVIPAKYATYEDLEQYVSNITFLIAYLSAAFSVVVIILIAVIVKLSKERRIIR